MTRARSRTMIGAAAALMTTTASRSSGFVHVPSKLLASSRRQTQVRHFMAAKTSQSAQLYVANISYGTDEQSLRNHFERYGKVADISLPIDRNNTTKNRGFAFLTLEDKETAEAILRDTSSSHLIDGRNVLLSLSHPRGQRNPNRFDDGNADMKRTIYTIDDTVCLPADEEVLRKIATKHCKSLDKYLENSPIAAHTEAAFLEVKRYSEKFFPDGAIPKHSSPGNSDEPGLILDSGVGTGRSSRMLGG